MELFYNHQQLTSEHSIYISMKFPNHFQKRWHLLKKDLLVKTGAETPQKQENATL